MKYVYCRVSTASQDLDLQLPTLDSEGCDKIYSEKSTGTKAGRPQFVELLPLLKKGDTLVVTKLERFASSTEDGVNLIKELLSKRFKVHILNMGLAEDKSIGRLILRTLSAIAKQNPNFREGWPKKFTKKQVAHALQLLKTNSYTQVQVITGISKSILIRAKRELSKGVPLFKYRMPLRGFYVLFCGYIIGF
ncbi:recombinase family protein [Sporosarcina sp. ANT_H38]|uniref:recombinase family protein n=1 Tax=Sporosarcina sp. ANT_H38 TaxID=2597358 RepID=UPI0011F347A9|nr:recombinase family protein [Sporosarcina sp. ANT_H38]KAA0941072.1 recombinase family protein [Sporosarcina sp. ANT_H38]